MSKLQASIVFGTFAIGYLFATVSGVVSAIDRSDIAVRGFISGWGFALLFATHFPRKSQEGTRKTQ